MRFLHFIALHSAHEIDIFRHESKSTELWTELKICLIATQEPLTTLFIKMAAFIPQREQMNVKDVGSWLEVSDLFVFHFY